MSYTYNKPKARIVGVDAVDKKRQARNKRKAQSRKNRGK